MPEPESDSEEELQISLKDKAPDDVARENANGRRDVVSWRYFENLGDDVEKLIFPLRAGDQYDSGQINEVLSQAHVFQGTLECFNESKETQMVPQCLNLPLPPNVYIF